MRSVVTKALEEARAVKQIASSLEAEVVVGAPASVAAALRRYEEQRTTFPGNLANLFIVSRASVSDAEGEVKVEVRRAAGGKCERCWTYSTKVGSLGIHAGVCERCAAVLEVR